MNIKKLDTPNKALRGANIPDLIVCHIADGTYQGTIGWEQTPAPKNPDQVSSHFIIGRDGEVTQMVGIDQCAWTQGLPTNLIQKATLPIVRQRGINPNVYCVSIEHEGFYAQTHGALTDAQLASSIELHKFIISEVKRIYGTTIPADRDHIVGHYQINPINKPNCPGELFPFDRIIAALNPVPAAAAPLNAMPSGDPAVKTYQQKLNRLHIGAPLAVDGVRGQITINAIKLFQSICGIAIDGVYGTQSDGAYQAIVSKPTLKQGSTGVAVRYMQYRLGCAIDGQFGAKTAAAVKGFQKASGLAADSIIGIQTWTKLIG